MKGERRHELERNELADWLAKTFAAIKPYQNAILGVVLLAVVATVGYSWWTRQSTGKQGTGWDMFHRALWKLSQGDPSPDDFETIAADFPDSDVALWARIMAADLHLAVGCDMLFTNKGIANQDLRKAEDHYLKILGAEKSSDELRERATFGLARARESQGLLQKAMEHYEEIGTKWKDGAYAAAAADRLRDLKKADTGLLYNRFAKFDPKPISLEDPSGPGGPLPFGPESLPDEPLFEPKLPDLQEKGVDDKESPDSPDTPAKPAGIEPGGAELGSTDAQPPDKEATDQEPADPAATDPGTTDAGDAKPGTPDTEKAKKDDPDSAKTDAENSDPADSLPTPPEKSDQP